MSDMAKKARAAMKAKAKGMSSADPHQKVDSSTWSPPEALNTEAKTGLRPVSRRAFKAGGKVEGKKAHGMIGKKSRAKGGSAMPPVDRFINRDMKKANDLREGVKHVGALKRGGKAYCGGGRTKRDDGGQVDEIAKKIRDYDAETANASMAKSKPVPTPPTGRPASPPSQERPKYEIKSPYKKGGRAKKADGGVGQEVPSERFKFSPGKAGSIFGRKHGGKVHDDVAADKALIKKMVKPSARTGKKDGGPNEMADKIERGLMADAMKRTIRKPMSDDVLRAGLKDTYGIGAEAPKYTDPYDYYSSIEGKKRGGRTKRQDGGVNIKKIPMGVSGLSPDDQVKWEKYKENYTPRPFEKEVNPIPLPNNPEELTGELKFKKGGRAKHKDGGKVFTGPSYPGKVPGAVGGRTAHASGGKAGAKKGTNITMIFGGKDMQPQMPMQGGPAGAPMGPGGPGGPGPAGVPVPVAGPGAPPPAAMPMPMPMPMPQQGPAPRKHGGRLTKKARTYKDMEAGAGSAEGRLQKTDIAKHAH